MTWTSL